MQILPGEHEGRLREKVTSRKVAVGMGRLPVDRFAQKSFNANIDVSLSNQQPEFCYEFCCCSLLVPVVLTNSFSSTLVNFNYAN